MVSYYSDSSSLVEITHEFASIIGAKSNNGMRQVNGVVILSYKWSGILTPSDSARYTIYAQHRGPVTVRFSDPLDPSNPSTTSTLTFNYSGTNLKLSSGTVDLVAGVTQFITVTYVPSGSTEFSLSWSYNGGSTPNSQVAIPGNLLQGLQKISDISIAVSA
jgi:hypothetical protein